LDKTQNRNIKINDHWTKMVEHTNWFFFQLVTLHRFSVLWDMWIFSNR
jgi:hypothetical protein